MHPKPKASSAGGDPAAAALCWPAGRRPAPAIEARIKDIARIAARVPRTGRYGSSSASAVTGDKD
jgi:hypothetical protein